MFADVARPPRPAQVTVAFWLQFAAVALLLGIVGLVIADALHFDGEISRAAALVPDADPAEVSSERSGIVFMALFLGVPTLLLAVWLAATAVPLLRGSNVARILVFVAGGAQLLLCLLPGCGGFLLVPLFLALGDADVTGPDEMPPQESKFLETLYSGSDSFSELSFLVGAAGALAALVLTGAVVLLVALPPAHRYFVPRAATPPAPVWPATIHPGGGYPLPVPYMICPDPSVHFAPDAAPPVSDPPPAAPPEPTTPPTTTTDHA
ncbi:hypothetical protein ABT297_15535 [Dactylosporangium sp. NPDC000555]|uniref:hypothetical protein n=1 Tax=Dactylosporangium sp. NPDC000555 TaxID=3154260 RepID=UPI00332EC76E